MSILGRKVRGFTLIEILVVITIIVVLTGIAVPALIWTMRRAKIVKIQGEIKNLDTQIVLYESSYGRYPTEMANYSSAALYDALYKNLAAANRRPLYDFDQKRVSGDRYYSAFGVDPKFEYHYAENASKPVKTPDMKRPYEFDIWTYDGKSPGDPASKDISVNNWQ